MPSHLRRYANWRAMCLTRGVIGSRVTKEGNAKEVRDRVRGRGGGLVFLYDAESRAHARLKVTNRARARTARPCGESGI